MAVRSVPGIPKTARVHCDESVSTKVTALESFLDHTVTGQINNPSGNDRRRVIPPPEKLKSNHINYV